MPRKTRDRHHVAFRPEDDIDELFGNANPNGNRTNCPRPGILRDAGRKELPIDHPVYEHLAECSECYQEFRRYQDRFRSPWHFRPALAAAAAVLVAVVGITFLARSLDVGPWRDNRSTALGQPFLIDYRAVSPTRSEGGVPARKPVQLPRANLNASILLPIGSEPGPYEVQLVGADRRVRLSKHEPAYLKDFAVKIDLKIDLRSFPRGPYDLGIRHSGEDWDIHPVVIQ